MKRSRTGGMQAFLIGTLAALLLFPLSARAYSLTAQPSDKILAAFSMISFYPNIATAGVVVTGVDLPSSAQLLYQRVGDIAWKTGHPLVRVDDGRLIGSLFWLSPSTSYNVRVTDGATEIIGSFVTQPEDLPFVPLSILYVNDDAPPGGNGSATAPFRTIQEAVNFASPGTQVLVADGIYRESVSFPTSGAPSNWIQVKAEGNGAILDGAETISGNAWTPVEGKNNIYFTKLGGAIGYLARDGKRFYQYEDMNGLNNKTGHNNITVNEGWYFEPATLKLFVRTQDDPNAHTWQVPRYNHAFDVAGRDWIWIEGFEMRFYGTRTDGCGVCSINASHLVIRRNKIHNMQLGIFVQWNNGIDSQGNDTRIEFNEVYDPWYADWEWRAVKGGNLEGTGIVVRTHTGAIVRGNEVHHIFNGIYVGTSGANAENPAITFDADIYNNRIHHIGDDGLEPEGACINVRFRNNAIDTTLTGISLAPITFGPTWVLRNTVANYSGKAIKWDRNSDGYVYLYHNTAWTSLPSALGMELISPVRNVSMRNNIIQSTGLAVTESLSGSLNNSWNYDNWFTAQAGPRFRWENVNYNNTVELCAASALECNGFEHSPGLVNPGGGDLSLLATSPNVDRGVLIPGINDRFSGVAPDLGAYEFSIIIPSTITPTTQALPTFSSTVPPTAIVQSTPSITPFPNTFPTNTPLLPSPTQSFPTQTPLVDIPPQILSIARMDANPTGAAGVQFRVTVSEPVSGVDTFAPFSDFALTASAGISGAIITGVIVESPTSYAVQVFTGNGSGTLQLNLVDDDSIRDTAGQSIGGAGAGNGNFIAGEIYTINKTIPATIIETFRSVASNDGWVLESQKTSERGGSKNAADATFSLGDDARDRQYISILHFSTSSLPDNAVVTKVTLMIRSQSYVGTNPFSTHQNIAIDIQKGYFGSSGLLGVNSLDRGDFQAPASQNGIGVIQNNPITDWYWSTLDSAGSQFINLTGVTELRLRFQLPDNGDRNNDFIRFYSGNYHSSTSHPILQIEYYVP